MRGIRPEDLEKVRFYVSARTGEPFSVGQLAKALGVAFMTARRRLEAYAATNDLKLEPSRARVGGRGPQSTTWSLQPVDSNGVEGEMSIGIPGASTVLDSARPERAAVPSSSIVPPAPPPELPFTARPDLTPDENRALDLLAITGTARTTELAQRLHRSPVRIDGIMRALIRKLNARGTPQFIDEELPSGELLYRALEGVTP